MKQALIIGGSGFVGKNLSFFLAKANWHIKILTRNPTALRMENFSDIGKVEIIKNDFSKNGHNEKIKSLSKGCDWLINCIGTIFESKEKMHFTNYEIPQKLSQIAAEEGCSMLHFSALGIEDQSSYYSEFKKKAEEEIKKNVKNSIIIRPSAIFGPRDKFLSAVAAMVRYSPAIALPFSDTKFQPILISDLCEFAKDLMENKKYGLYEAGGKDILTFRQIFTLVAEKIGKNKSIMAIPDIITKSTLGLLSVPFRLFGSIFPSEFKNLMQNGSYISKRSQKTLIGRSFEQAIEEILYAWDEKTL